MMWPAILTRSWGAPLPVVGGGPAAPTPNKQPRIYSFLRQGITAPMTFINVPAYPGGSWYVDADLGSDTNDGRALNQGAGTSGPTKSYAHALNLVKIAGMPDDAVVWLRGGRIYREYLNADSSYGLSSADALTITNDASTLQGFGGRTGHELHVRTWHEDLHSGFMAVLDGAGIATDFEAVRSQYWAPNLIGLQGAHDLRFYDLELRSSAGSAIHLVSDASGNMTRNVRFRNCHIHHNYGAATLAPGSRDSHFEFCSVHHHHDDAVVAGVETRGAEGHGIKMAGTNACSVTDSVMFMMSGDGINNADSIGNEWHRNRVYYAGLQYAAGLDANNIAQPDVAGQRVGDDWWSNAFWQGFDPGNDAGIGIRGCAAARGSRNLVHMCIDNSVDMEYSANYVLWNNTSAWSAARGFVAHNVGHLLNNLDYGSARPVLLDNAGGATPYARANSWPNDALSGGRITGNFAIALTATDFLSDNPTDTDFMTPDKAGQIDDHVGVTNPSAFSGWTGWGSVSIPASELSGTIGVRTAVGTPGAIPTDTPPPPTPGSIPNPFRDGTHAYPFRAFWNGGGGSGPSYWKGDPNGWIDHLASLKFNAAPGIPGSTTESTSGSRMTELKSQVAHSASKGLKPTLNLNSRDQVLYGDRKAWAEAFTMQNVPFTVQNGVLKPRDTTKYDVNLPAFTSWPDSGSSWSGNTVTVTSNGASSSSRVVTVTAKPGMYVLSMDIQVLSGTPSCQLYASIDDGYDIENNRRTTGEAFLPLLVGVNSSSIDIHVRLKNSKVGSARYTNVKLTSVTHDLRNVMSNLGGVRVKDANARALSRTVTTTGDLNIADPRAGTIATVRVDKPNGTPVTVDYESLTNQNKTHMLNHPDAFAWLTNRLLLPTRVMYSAHPPVLAHINLDELRGMNRDARSPSFGKSNRQFLFEYVTRFVNAVRAVWPDIYIIMWDDMLVPGRNGGRKYQTSYGGRAGSTEGIINDLATIPGFSVVIWNYSVPATLQSEIPTFNASSIKPIVGPGMHVGSMESWRAATTASAKAGNVSGVMYMEYNNGVFINDMPNYEAVTLT